MEALLATTYLADATGKKKTFWLPVELLEAEFYAGGEKIVCIKVQHGDGWTMPFYVSPDALYDTVEKMALSYERYFGVWVSEQRIKRDNPNIVEDLDNVLLKIGEGELEDQDAFDAVEALGFANWEADYIVNYWVG